MLWVGIQRLMQEGRPVEYRPPSLRCVDCFGGGEYEWEMWNRVGGVVVVENRADWARQV